LAAGFFLAAGFLAAGFFFAAAFGLSSVFAAAGFRASLSQIEIESIGGTKRAESARPKEAKQDAVPAAPKGLPKEYEDMTVAQIADAAPGWRRPQLEAALEYERTHADRKGAVAALETALAAKEEG